MQFVMRYKRLSAVVMDYCVTFLVAWAYRKQCHVVVTGRAHTMLIQGVIDHAV